MDSDNHRFFSHLQPSFWLEEVPDREDEMREMLEAYQEWNKKYPSNKIFSHSEMQKIIGELDSIMDKSEELLNKQ